MDKKEQIWKLDIKAKEKIALLFLLDQMGEDGVCTVSLTLVATRCGFPDRTDASKVTNALARQGLLKIIGNGNTPDGRQKHNSYRLTLDQE